MTSTEERLAELLECASHPTEGSEHLRHRDILRNVDSDGEHSRHDDGAEALRMSAEVAEVLKALSLV
jgi:hypothetical protein